MTKHLADHEKPFQCKLCGKGFAVSSKIRRHIKGVHNQKPKPGETFSFPENITK